MLDFCLLHFLLSFLSLFVHMWKMNDISKCFFSYFQNFQWFRGFFFFGGGGEGWGRMQKMAQNDKNLCLSHSVSQEPYSIWFWFLVHMCKMMISLAMFFILSNFWFFGFLGGRGWGGGRRCSQSVTLYHIWRTINHIKIFGTQV